MKKVNIALIGCGAVAEAHLAAASDCKEITIKALVDKNIDRALKLGKRFGISEVFADFHDVFGLVDAAIVALPHHLHAPITIELLDNGLHTLVEKPMALNKNECANMIAAAKKSGKILTVGQLRRYFYSSIFVKKLLDLGVLGKIKKFHFQDGIIYNWPAASDFTFKSESGGGTLADQGAHTLDLMRWWLGDYESFEYFDDSFGGVEAECVINIKLKSGASGEINMSRIRNLANNCYVEGENGWVRVESKFNSQVEFQLFGQDAILTGRPLPQGMKKEDPIGLFVRQLDDFAAAINGRKELFVFPEDAMKTVELIEACHANRKFLAHPWASLEMSNNAPIAKKD